VKKRRGRDVNPRRLVAPQEPAYDEQVLVGRHEEQGRIESLLRAARRGASGVLVLRGEAGVGKSALLDSAAAAAKEIRVLRVRGIESESELPFSGLLELLRPLLIHLERLPKPQAAALKRALAIEATGSNDIFAVYAGTLGLPRSRPKKNRSSR
jgi:predicted ATPase